MQILTYRARNLKEALQQVRDDLGPDTKVVQTREVRVGWWDRFSRGRQFEIRTRIAQAQAQPLPLRRRNGTRPDSGSDSTPPDVATETVARGTPDTSRAEQPELTSDFANRVRSRLQLEFADGNGTVEAKPPTSDNQRGPHPALFELLAQLVEAEVPEQTARELMDLVPAGDRQAGFEKLTQSLIDQLAYSVNTTGPIGAADQQQIVALVGPTGVGKTTTIAKLAADLRLRERRRVGLITVDTYRVAAVDQLQTYADIMDLPMEVVATPREMRDAVTRFADEELVLIDTAGRSPHDAVQLQQLKSMLAEARPTQIHLVLSCVSSVSHMQQIVEKFAPLGCTAMLVTKLDEATGIGNLVPVFRQARLPVSYLTCGQSVPDDMVVADKSKLLEVLVGQQPISSLV